MDEQTRRAIADFKSRGFQRRLDRRWADPNFRDRFGGDGFDEEDVLRERQSRERH